MTPLCGGDQRKQVSHTVYIDKDQKLSIMSISFLLENQNDAIVWRGTKKTGEEQNLKMILWTYSRTLCDIEFARSIQIDLYHKWNVMLIIGFVGVF